MRGAAWALAAVLATAAFAGQNYPDQVLHPAADSAKCLTIVIVANRFPQALLATDGTTPTTSNQAQWWEPNVTDQPSFKRCADAANEGLFGHEPFKTYGKAFQVVRVDVPSPSDQPDKGAFRDSPAVETKKINILDEWFGNPTALDDNIYYLGTKYRSDNTMIIMNVHKHGGANVGGVSVLPYNTKRSTFGYVAAHEMGHGLFSLADEYDEDKTPAGQPLSSLAGAPNVDFVPTLEQTKWAKWKGFDKSIGPPFQDGGGYVKGTAIWHPTKECLMNRNEFAPYCVVCREAAIAKIYNRVSLITGTTPDAGQRVKVNAGDSATFAVSTDYAGTEGIVVDWILDGKNLLSRSGTAGGTSSGQGILSVTVTSTDLGYDGDHELIALVRDSKAHPQTKSQPVEAVWSIYYGPTRRTEPQFRGIR